jgi:predicted ferric reductase
MEPLDVATELAAATGLTAAAMLLLQFLTSGRLGIISRQMGLDVAMSFHRVAATAILLLIALHVSAHGLMDGEWRPSHVLARISHLLAAPSARTGVVAAALLAVLVLTARCFRGRGVRYEVWRLGHGIAAVAAVGLTADHAWRLGTYVREPAVALAFLTLTAWAAAVLALVYAVRPISTRRAGFSVERVTRLSADIVELVLRAGTPGSFPFKAGQFVWLTFGRRHTVTDNPFSIASAPDELPILRFLIREVGDTTCSLVRLRAGVPVAVDGPHGNFVEEGREAGALIFVAGGIGLAPVLGILRSLQARADRRPIRLLVAGRSPNDLVALEEIVGMQRQLDLQVIVLVENPPVQGLVEHGRPSEAHLARLLYGINRKGVAAFVCGPPAMMDLISAALLSQGLHANQIAMERFDYDTAHDPVSRAIARRLWQVLALVGLGVAAFAIRGWIMGA